MIDLSRDKLITPPLEFFMEVTHSDGRILKARISSNIYSDKKAFSDIKKIPGITKVVRIMQMGTNIDREEL